MTKTSVSGESDYLAADRADARRRIRLRRPQTAPISDEVDDTGLREKVTRGLGWKLLTVTIAQLSQSFVAILLAHLLLPQDFGLAGMALAFSGIATILTDLSLGAALVQRRVLTERDRSTVFWTTAAGGVLWCLVGIGISPLVADFFREPKVAPLFAAVSVGFLFTALAQTQTALLTREMRFRSLQLRQIAATLVGAVVAVALALAGAGPWAIIAQLLCTYGISTVLLWTVSPWRPQFVFSRESFRTLGSFGVKSLLSKLLLYINLNGDNLLIGRFLGTEALGIYAVAYNVMLLPMSRVTMPIRDVFYAAFARLQHDPRRLGDAWLRVNRLASALRAGGAREPVGFRHPRAPATQLGGNRTELPVLQRERLPGLRATGTVPDLHALLDDRHVRRVRDRLALGSCRCGRFVRGRTHDRALREYLADVPVDQAESGTDLSQLPRDPVEGNLHGNRDLRKPGRSDPLGSPRLGAASDPHYPRGVRLLRAGGQVVVRPHR